MGDFNGDTEICTTRYHAGADRHMEAETLGISIFNQATIMDEFDDLYVALTGDQCALTDIHASSLIEKGDYQSC